MIKKLNVNCNSINRTLPLAFDESLSYLEMLCALLDKLNETIVQVNENTEVSTHYEELLEEITAKVDELEQEYIEFKEHIETEIDERFNVILSQLTTYVESQIAIIRYELTEMYNELDQKINDIVAGDINVYDPTTGVIAPIQTVINNLYDMSRESAITASEFDALELSATEFDSKQLTAFDFDINGKTLLTN